jgi:pantoate--beta-alanine ligase
VQSERREQENEQDMKIIETVKEMQAFSNRMRQEGKIVGFVPTMGYLHEGHLSLLRIARGKADVLVLSIYVNPTQFGPNEDLEKYPRDFKLDEALAKNEGVDVLFYPSDHEMYPEGFLSSVSVRGITEVLCGASRPHHFQGVTTICAKLFHAVHPHFAVFGQKDYQQCVVIERMVKDLNFDLEIIMGPIVREADGLAMSSRNTYLSFQERSDALAIKEALKLVDQMVSQGERKTGVLIREMTRLIESRKSLRIDYVRVVHPDHLYDLEIIEDRAVAALAVFAGKTRLIDNTILEL